MSAGRFVGGMCVFGRAGAEGARWGAPVSLSALPLEQSAVGEAAMEVEP